MSTSIILFFLHQNPDLKHLYHPTCIQFQIHNFSNSCSCSVLYSLNFAIHKRIKTLNLIKHYLVCNSQDSSLLTISKVIQCLQYYIMKVSSSFICNTINYKNFFFRKIMLIPYYNIDKFINVFTQRNIIPYLIPPSLSTQSVWRIRKSFPCYHKNVYWSPVFNVL
jgi:hypothetical protein